MKSKNHESIKNLLVVLSLAFVANMISCQRMETVSVPGNTLLFEGIVERLAPDPGTLSGRIAVYRLAKYRVKRVCEGKYERDEIVVDHLVFDGREFENVKIGDRVCVTVKITDRVLARYDADGIRSPADVIDTFYVAADRIVRSDQGLRCCQ